MPTMLLKNGKRLCDKELIVIVKNRFIVVSGTADLRPEKHFKAHPCFFVELRVLVNGSLNGVLYSMFPAIYGTGK